MEKMEFQHENGRVDQKWGVRLYIKWCKCTLLLSAHSVEGMENNWSFAIVLSDSADGKNIHNYVSVAQVAAARVIYV